MKKPLLSLCLALLALTGCQRSDTADGSRLTVAATALGKRSASRGGS